MIIPRIFKPLGWALWKLNIAGRDVHQVSDPVLYVDGQALTEGIDWNYISSSDAVIFNEPPNNIEVRRKVLCSKYTLFE